MIESAFFLASVHNKKTGLVETKLDTLFYGDGKPETDTTPKERLLRWQVTDSEELMDQFEFSLENNDLKLFDSKLLAKGNTVTFQYGYPNNMSAKFVGVITKRTGWRTINIGGQFKSEVVLADRQHTEKFLNKKISDVAKELFEREGLAAHVDDTGIVYPVIIKRDETVLQFLKRKAREAGGAYEVYVSGNTGFFAKKKLEGKPVIILKYGTEVTDLDYVTIGDPDFKDEQVNTAVEQKVKGFDMLEKKPINEKANNDNSTQTSLGKGSYYFDEATGTRKFKSKGAQRSEETGMAKPTSKQKAEGAKAEAISSFDSKNAKAFQLSWEIVGDPTVSAKTIAFIDVESKTIAGRWYIWEVAHKGNGGSYETEIQMIRNALGQAVPGVVDATPKGANNTKDPDTKSKVVYEFDLKTGTRVPVKR